MFTIIGGDGKEYGPASAEQLRNWIASGRANLETKARALGADEWRRLGDFPEFAPDGAPPVIGAAASATAYTPVPAVASAELAGQGARLGAALINAFLYFLAVLPGAMVMSVQLLKQYPDLAQGGLRLPTVDPAILAPGLIWVRAGIGAAMLVQALLLGVRGQNIGKLIVSARVVRTDDQPAGWFRGVVLRFLFPIALMLVLNAAFPLLGCLFLLVDFCFMFRGDRRCLHDLIAGTKVVKT